MELKDAFCGVTVTKDTWENARFGIKARLDGLKERPQYTSLVLLEKHYVDGHSVHEELISELKVSQRF